MASSPNIARGSELIATLVVALCCLSGCGGSSKNTEDGPAPRDANGTYVADYIETQGGAPALNRDAERATMLDRTSQMTARGESAGHDLHILISRVRAGEPAAFEISTAGFAALECAGAIVRSRSARPAGYRLLVYKNPRRVKLLYSTVFRSGEPPHAFWVQLDGAVDVWLVWEALDRRPQPSAEFVMTSPRFTGHSQ